MKQYISVFIGLLAINYLSAQVIMPGTPKSFSEIQYKSVSKIETSTLRKLDVQKQQEKDAEENIDNRYSVYKKVDIDIKSKGTQTQTENGIIWRYQIKSKNTLSLSIIFSEYMLPEGAELYLYSIDRSIVRGAFTSINNKEYGSLSLADFPGEELIVEYYEPTDVSFAGKLVVGSVGRAYRSINGTNIKSTDENDINITCEEGNNYQTEKHAVAKMTFKVGSDGYVCTGALINNTRNDGTPYFLTANHCISTNDEAKTLVTYFNYERENCNGNIKAPQTLSGSILKATNQASDFTLLLLNANPTAAYKPFFAGWDASITDYFVKGFGIHHPGGDVKKIAIELDTISSYDFPIGWEDETVSEPGTHWLVNYNEGATQGGSSGSPLFDDKSRIIGQLHGGAEGFDFYGKLSSSWNNGILDKTKLRPFLDPDNSGVKAIDAYYPASNLPGAFLYTPFTTVCAEEPISFFDGSAFTIDSWNWQFTPSDVQFHNGTDKNSKNPVVSFNSSGAYSVSLQVSNSNGSENISRINYITSGSSLNPKIKALDGTSSWYCLFDELRFTAEGADSFQWDVIKGMEYVFIDETTPSNTFRIYKNDAINITSNQNIELRLIGSQGVCSDTTVQLITLFKFNNDSIENALELNYGKSGPFSNYCASIQKNEPNPVAAECNSKLAWCACETSDTILDNSVWFSFLAPSSGIVGVNAPGFDNQIAIYEAGSVEDIMSGNPSKYSIIAANDDYFGEDKNYSALIKGATVVPNRKYWLQVDGSACGAFGEFMIELYPYDISDSFPTNIHSIEENQEFVIFPNPLTSVLNIHFEDEFRDGVLNLVSMDGRIVMEKQIPNATEVAINLSNNISNGIYVLRIVNSEKLLTKQIVVQKRVVDRHIRIVFLLVLVT